MERYILKPGATEGLGGDVSIEARTIEGLGGEVSNGDRDHCLQDSMRDAHSITYKHSSITQMCMYVHRHISYTSVHIHVCAQAHFIHKRAYTCMQTVIYNGDK